MRKALVIALSHRRQRKTLGSGPRQPERNPNGYSGGRALPA